MAPLVFFPPLFRWGVFFPRHVSKYAELPPGSYFLCMAELVLLLHGDILSTPLVDGVISTVSKKLP